MKNGGGTISLPPAAGMRWIIFTKKTGSILSALLPGKMWSRPGVNNVDAQMRQKEALERMQAEQVIYSRISALAGDFLSIYTVDPETDHYVEYSSSRHYDTLGLAKEGDDFFGTARRLGEKFVYKDDLPIYRDFFTKENILKEIRKNGLFVMQYRLIVDGKPVYINARAALVEEKEGPKLIIGLNNVDTQVKIGKKRKAQNRVK